MVTIVMIWFEDVLVEEGWPEDTGRTAEISCKWGQEPGEV